jgi:hypothetical protein
MTVVLNQSLKAQPRKALTTDPEELKTRLNDLVDAVVFQTGNAALEATFNSYVAKDVLIGAGVTLAIQHFLGVIPKWRIILRQTGNGVITDVSSDWNTRSISLKNNGTEDVIISVLIVRE